MPIPNITDRKVAYDGHYKLSLLTVQAGDEQLRRERFEPGQAAAALVWHPQKQQYLLTRQFRVGSETELVELAAGMIEGDEAPDAAIRREIQEELGYDVDRLEQIARFYPSPGASAEVITVFFAEVSHRSGAGGGVADEHEDIETVAFTREELQRQVFEDAKTLVAVQWAQLHHK